MTRKQTPVNAVSTCLELDRLTMPMKKSSQGREPPRPGQPKGKRTHCRMYNFKLAAGTGLPATTPPRKKSPLRSSVRRLGALAAIDAGSANVSAKAVCAYNERHINARDNAIL